MEERSMYYPRPKRGKGILRILLILILLIVAAWFVLFRLNRFTLSIRLAGEEKTQLEYGDRKSVV